MRVSKGLVVAIMSVSVSLWKATSRYRHGEKEQDVRCGSQGVIGWLSLAFSGIASFAAVIASVGSLIQANLTQRQLQDALDDQRPWVKINVLPSDVSWLDIQQIVSYYPQLIITNVGKEPARKVHVSYRLTVGDVVVGAQSAVCREGEPMQTASKTLFPGEDADASYQGAAKLGASARLKSTASFEINFYGCVIYQDARSHTVYHHTYFGFGIWKVDKPASPNSAAIISHEIPYGITVPKREVFQFPWTTQPEDD